MGSILPQTWILLISVSLILGESMIPAEQLLVESERFAVRIDERRVHPADIVSLSVLDKVTRLSAEIEIEERLDRVNELRFITEQRLCVIGERRWWARVVVIIDLQSARVVDTFRASNVLAFSHSARYLVFQRFAPRFTPSGLTFPILLYDFAKSPSENRMIGSSLDDSEQVGTPLFPEENFVAKSYSPTVAQVQYLYNSPLVWADDDSSVSFLASKSNIEGEPPVTNLFVTLIIEGSSTSRILQTEFEIESLVDLSKVGADAARRIREKRVALGARSMEWIQYPDLIRLDTDHFGQLFLNLDGDKR